MYTMDYYRDHKEAGALSMRKTRLKTFGLSIEQYDAMLISQGGLCAICGSVPSDARSLAVDHDHDTGLVRGLLCTACNVYLGRIGDSPKVLQTAIKYLTEVPV